MQKLIDVTPEAMEDIKNDRASRCFLQNKILNGKPLPKGHGRLIDADEIQFENREFDTYGDYSRAFDAIDYAETIVEADKEGSDSE